MALRTFPFKVVAANNLASTGADVSRKMACVVVHASDCDKMSVRSRCGIMMSTHRFLELFEILVGFRLLFARNVTLHRCQRRKHRRIVAGCVCSIGHGGMIWGWKPEALSLGVRRGWRSLSCSVEVIRLLYVSGRRRRGSRGLSRR